jgi:hypothetical protein
VRERTWWFAAKVPMAWRAGARRMRRLMKTVMGRYISIG